MEQCFREEELQILIKNSGNEMLPAKEQIANYESILCPFCKQKHLKYAGCIGDMSEALFHCENCLFMAGFKELTEKDQKRVVLDFFQVLNRKYEKVKKELDLIMNAIMQYRPSA